MRTFLIIAACLLVALGLAVWRMADGQDNRAPHTTPITSFVFILRDGSCITLQPVRSGVMRVVTVECPP